MNCLPMTITQFSNIVVVNIATATRKSKGCIIWGSLSSSDPLGYAEEYASAVFRLCKWSE